MTKVSRSPKELLFIVPMKDPKRAKSRLSNVLADATRQRLALTLYRQTLAFLTKLAAQSQHGFDILVVTDSGALADLAKAYGVETLQQIKAGLNEAVKAGCQWAKDHDYRSVCILPADLADHDGAEFSRLLNCPRDDHSIIICPSQDQGTNALLITPPDAMDFYYGRRSFHRHLNEAERKGLHAMILPLEGISHDIDSASDLAHPIASSLRSALSAGNQNLQEAGQ